MFLSICWSAEIYIAAAAVNLLLFVILIHEVGHDYITWFVFFEISLITGISALTLESRSFRRIYALVVMMVAAISSGALAYLALNLTRDLLGLTWLGTVIATVVVLVKTPCYPASVWLPEAHVEASWPGSIVLAAFALKFSVLATLLFVLVKFLEVDVLGTFLLFSVIYAGYALSGTVDIKKLIANFSIVHMSVTAYLAAIPSVSDWALNFSWHHHSVVTSWLFLLVGFLYAFSGSRVFRMLVSSRDAVMLALLVFLITWTVSLDLPWTPNAVIELYFIRAVGPYVPVLLTLLVVFWAVIIAVLICSSSKISPQKGGDLSTATGSFLLVTQLAIMLAGFVGEWGEMGT